MRYYLPLGTKQVSKNRTPLAILPLWVWLIGIAICMLFVLALR